MKEIINAFPGYEYIPKNGDTNAKNMYMGEDAGFGGYVYVEEGIYTNAALLDIASMHPSSIVAMNCFGDYTKKFKDILDARIAIKHKDWDKARTMLDGALAPYLENEELADILSTALKIPINSVYGLTSAKFSNPFKDPRNVNNIVALRGALFMITLKNEIIKRGYKPFHFKTDSVKIANADDKIISFCMDFARQYGYEFEHEATYKKICIVNGSTYIAKYDEFGQRNKGGKNANEWTATAAQFQQPYVFKTLFSHEKLVFNDFCETKEVKTALYLDMNENLEDVSQYELIKDIRKQLSNGKEVTKKNKVIFDETIDMTDEEIEERISKGHDYRFIGKVGSFCPINPGFNGGELFRSDGDKMNAVVGTKGYRWLESEIIKEQNWEPMINKDYYISLANEAIDAISQYGDYEWFVSDDN